MDIQEKALKANGKSHACGKCPLGIANCTETISIVCRNAFVEGYTKGYKQSKEDEKERISSILHPVNEPCGKNEIFVFFRDVRRGKNQPDIELMRFTNAESYFDISSVRFPSGENQPQKLQIAWCYPKDLIKLLGYDKRFKEFEEIAKREGLFLILSPNTWLIWRSTSLCVLFPRNFIITKNTNKKITMANKELADM